MRKYPKLIADLPSSIPFVGPEAQERSCSTKFVARIGANENVFGPSPEVIEAIRKSSVDIWMYGDPENYDLKLALSKHHGISVENIAVGEGIDGLLGYLCRLLVEPGVNVVTSKGAYPTFNYHVTGFGGNLHLVDYKKDYEDLEGLLLKAKKTNAAIIYLANPDNPMGTWHENSAIEEMIEHLPEETLLCLDEAYSEFAPLQERAQFSSLNSKVIRFRTFSKAYGMAGARVGYAIGPSDLIKSFDKIRNHFGINIIAQKAALAALKDQKYLTKVLKLVEHSKIEIARIANSFSLKTIPSFANFVSIDCGRDELFAQNVLKGLVSRNIFARMPFFPPQNRCIRISAGKPEDLQHFETALSSVIKDLGQN